MSRNAETFKNGAKKSPARCTTLCNAFIPKTPDQSPLIAPSCENVGASHRSTSEPSPSGSCDGGRWYTLNSPKKLGAVRISLSCSMTGGGVASRTGSGGAGGGGGGRRLVGMSRRLLGRKSLNSNRTKSRWNTHHLSSLAAPILRVISGTTPPPTCLVYPARASTHFRATFGLLRASYKHAVL